MRYLKSSEEDTGSSEKCLVRADVDGGLAKPTFRCWLQPNEFANSPGRSSRSNGGEDEKLNCKLPEAEDGTAYGG